MAGPCVTRLCGLYNGEKMAPLCAEFVISRKTRFRIPLDTVVSSR
jgi:hypothetical protein